MAKFERLRIWVGDEGVIGLIKAVFVTTIYLTPLYWPLERVLGRVRHEQLIRAPRLGYWPDIETPETFNEKLLHRKLFTEDDRFVRVADKWRVREYVREKAGNEVLNEVYQTASEPEEINFETLPDRFVVKANHGCGWNVFVEDQSTIDTDALRERCREWIDLSYGRRKREYWYAEIEPVILIERYIDGDGQRVPRDYKFFVFDGRVEYIEVDYDRYEDHSRRFFDRNWNPQKFRLEFPMGPTIDAPPDLETMIEVAERLGDEFEAIRVDLYNPEPGRVIFGEITVAHGSGGEKFAPIDYDRELGELWPSASVPT